LRALERTVFVEAKHNNQNKQNYYNRRQRNPPIRKTKTNKQLLLLPLRLQASKLSVSFFPFRPGTRNVLFVVACKESRVKPKARTKTNKRKLERML